MIANDLCENVFLVFRKRNIDNNYVDGNCIFACSSQNKAIDIIIEEIKFTFDGECGSEFVESFGKWFTRYGWDKTSDWLSIEKLPQKVPLKRNFLHYISIVR
jgi:hypothetical protein